MRTVKFVWMMSPLTSRSWLGARTNCGNVARASDTTPPQRPSECQLTTPSPTTPAASTNIQSTGALDAGALSWRRQSMCRVAVGLNVACTFTAVVATGAVSITEYRLVLLMVRTETERGPCSASVSMMLTAPVASVLSAPTCVFWSVMAMAPTPLTTAEARLNAYSLHADAALGSTPEASSRRAIQADGACCGVTGDAPGTAKFRQPASNAASTAGATVDSAARSDATTATDALPVLTTASDRSSRPASTTSDRACCTLRATVEPPAAMSMSMTLGM
mmetsp:Transcript_22400/g.78486  ORF Transcript_22400/g.78486 Transcript_22400/m.78486 type:complete len:277 (+) Transcript_22400:2266-3096(+)